MNCRLLIVVVQISSKIGVKSRVIFNLFTGKAERGADLIPGFTNENGRLVH